MRPTRQGDNDSLNPTGRPLNRPHVWRPRGGEIVLESLLFEVDELNPPESAALQAQPIGAKVWEREVAKLVASGALGSRLPTDPDAAVHEIDTSVVETLVNLGILKLQDSNIDLAAFRDKYLEANPDRQRALRAGA